MQMKKLKLNPTLKSLITRLEEEVMKARYSKDTRLVARLQEAQREILYFHWVIEELSKTGDKDVTPSFLLLAEITREGAKVGMAHPVVHPIRR